MVPATPLGIFVIVPHLPVKPLHKLEAAPAFSLVGDMPHLRAPLLVATMEVGAVIQENTEIDRPELNEARAEKAV